jgi:hypothetical protein
MDSLFVKPKCCHGFDAKQAKAGQLRLNPRELLPVINRERRSRVWINTVLGSLPPHLPFFPSGHFSGDETQV